MREKLIKLMNNEGLTSSKLAEKLDIQPSAISHIMSGRNKGISNEMIRKILTTFPKISPDWLLLDREPMLRVEQENSQNKVADFSTQESKNETNTDSKNSETNPSLFNHIIENESRVQNSENSKLRSSKIARVVIFYDDNTFESFDSK